ncbi:hypothetical protein M9H77_23286 [Catharanthus roseus]|uniref:Uncharacterized protein n=1 Tax=Catharanthus roseus TaxID=4058 RepID=A0ACC0AVU3_CATRO|nr:hypothetical protein M9H77_23286 [Catharanthus roseus]
MDQSLELKRGNSEDNGMVTYLEEALKSKLEGFEGQERATKFFFVFHWSAEATKSSIEVLHQGGDLGKVLNQIYLQLKLHIKVVSEQPPIEGLILFIDGHLPTQSHQGGTSDRSRMNLNKTLRSMQQSIEGLARQFQSVARDVEELKNGKSSATMEQRVGDNLGGFNSPYHQRPFDNVSTYRYHDIPVQNSHSFHEGGYQGRPQIRGGKRGGIGGRGYHRAQEKFPRHEDNLYEDYGDNPNVGQAYHGDYYGNQQEDKALDKIKWKNPNFKGESDPNEFLYWERKVENLLIVRSYGDIFKVKLVIAEFSSYALHWWERIVIQRLRNRRQPIETWAELKTLMKERFVLEKLMTLSDVE